jgi:isopentenyldiphosphate isomerase
MAQYPNIATSDASRDWEVQPRHGEVGLQLVDAYREQETHRVAAVAIFNAAGQILLQKRGPNVLWPDVWDISVAGHVDAGTTYMQTAISETSSEVGIDITEHSTTHPLRFVAHFKSEEEVVAGTDQRVADVQSVSRWNTLYAYQLPEGVDLKIDTTGEVADAVWADPQDVRGMIAESPEEFRIGAVYAFEELFTAMGQQ